MTAQRIYHFSELDPDDNLTFGSLGKKFASLWFEKFPIADGFLISPTAYFDFLKENKLDQRIKKLLTTVTFDYPETLLQIEAHLKKMFAQASFSQSFINELQAYLIRIGQDEVTYNAKHTHVHATSLDELLIKIKQSWTEQFSAELLSHRNKHTIDHLSEGVLGVVQISIHPTIHGKIFTDNQSDKLHQSLVIQLPHEHGKDTYVLSKKNKTIIDRTITPHPKNFSSPNLVELKKLADLGILVEKHFYFPQEIDWAFQGDTLVLLHTKPQGLKTETKPERTKKHAVARGQSLTKTIATGAIQVVNSPADLKKLKPHAIIVVSKLMPELKKHLKNIRGIIYSSSELHSEMASLLRTHGIASIYHVKDATKKFKNGSIVTVHAGTGEIYSGGYHA